MVSATCALPKKVVLKVEGEAGQWPRRARWPMLSYIWGIFSSSFFFSFVSPLPPTSRPISQPWGFYPSLEAQIPDVRPKFQIPNFEGRHKTLTFYSFETAKNWSFETAKNWIYETFLQATFLQFQNCKKVSYGNDDFIFYNFTATATVWKSSFLQF